MKQETKRRVLRRLSIIEGQVKGLQKMVDGDTYCIDVITQSSAVRRALSSVEDLMLENHLTEHVVHQIRKRQEKRAIREIVAVFKRAKEK